ncbi:pantetheinase-like [Patiria miniata]|uniref:CN hydrolase domain-containing protein n=1 Tax=Patiria miniata TaxID=46514 RepID=A0A914B0D9_PATMI|nr:pantetheinase-like [Patiria miniata]
MLHRNHNSALSCFHFSSTTLRSSFGSSSTMADRTIPLILLAVAICAIGCSHGDSVTSHAHSGSSSFLAAVYQHAVHNWYLPNITHREALKLMNTNVDVYEVQVKVASSKGVSMIVFPEYGITGFQLSHLSIDPFLEYVPNPYKTSVNPCIQAEFKTSPILQRLSCLARKYSIIIVANLATMIPCNESRLQDRDCPTGGVYKYNTDVTLGADGKLLAKYNKEHLYAEELLMFQPGEGPDNLAVFKTDYGIFGLFTCFDMLFKEPAESLLDSLGVTNMVFPTAWMNELPLLSAVEYQEAWAIRFDVNLLAANIQLPIALMTGGGLYAGVQGAVIYHRDMTDFHGELLIGKLPVRPKRPPKINTKTFKDLSGQIRNLTPENLQMVSPIVKSILKDTAQSSWSETMKSSESSQEIRFSSSFTTPDKSSDKPFQSLMNHDLYTFVLLTQNTASLSVCSGVLCCHLNYTFPSMSSTKRDMFALGVFNGLHKHNGQYYVQTCALVKCRLDDQSSCGAETVQSNTRLESFSLAIEGYDQESRLFPSVLTSDVRLAIIGKDWESEFPFDHIWSESGTEGYLLAANIYGRWYEKD